MRVGIALPQFGEGPGSAPAIAGFAAHAERVGYASLWVADRLITPPEPVDRYPGPIQPYPSEFTRAADPLLTLTVAATVTRRVRLCSSTLNGPYYQPVHLARALTTLDVLSEGRLDIGLGLGWMREEYAASGVPWSGRGDRIDDLLDFLKRWWSSARVTHHSDLVHLDDVRVDLRPTEVGGPSVYLGGFSEASMDRVGRRASGWLTVDGLPAEHEAACWDRARRAAEQAGRDPDVLRRVVRLNASPAEDLTAVAMRIDAHAARGVDEVLVDLLFMGGDAGRSSELGGELAQLLGLTARPTQKR